MENLLPTEITLDIFSRLPAESVLQCRQVCKTWRALLHHPHFAHMHLQRSLQLDKVGLIYLNGSYGSYYQYLYYGVYDENDEQSYKTLTRINYPPIHHRDRVVASCNGLICFAGNDNHDLWDSVYICNPITREYVHLPSYNYDFSMLEDYFILPIHYGFGYISSTNEYKVVRILYSGEVDQPEPFNWVGRVQVYTIGGGSGWRDKGEITRLLSLYGVLANGVLHWLVRDEMKIVAFDLADEQFHLLPSPPCFIPGEDDFFKLRVFGGLLCIVHYKHGQSMNIWSLKRKRGTMYYTKEKEYESWCWHKECSMAWEGMLTQEYEPFEFTKSGEVLLWYNQNIPSPDKHKHSILSRFDPKIATLKKLDTDLLFLQATPHMNSFVSLKAQGEENIRIIREDEELPEPEFTEPNSIVGVEALSEEDLKIIGSAEDLREREVSEPYWEVKNFSFKFEATQDVDADVYGYSVICWSKEHNLEWRARLILDDPTVDLRKYI